MCHLEDAKKKLDKALKRNLEGQVKTTSDSPEKLITPESINEQVTEANE